MQKQTITLRQWDVLKHTLPQGFTQIEFAGGDQYCVVFSDGTTATLDGFEMVEVAAYADGETSILYTDAPLSYDGFGTTTLNVIRQTRQRRDLRRVLVLTEHAVWQINRYRSGLYVWLDQTQFAEMGDLI